MPTMTDEKKKTISSLATYRLLGRSGLRVSPLCLGTMTFGTEWGWGTEKEIAKSLYTRYLEAGGNFVDTADGYTNGRSEEWLGDFIHETGTRDQIVLATKFTFNVQPGNPNAGGNGRKNLYRALELSLKRLKTDYIDLYWMHAWDKVTPVEEVTSTLTDLVRAGKIRAYGFSDVPAWYAARAHTFADREGWEKPAALQLEYSLVSRNLEREHLPMAEELNMGLCPWSPLASGFLAGKYKRTAKGVEGSGRIAVVKDSGNPAFERMTNDRNWKILEALQAAAQDIGRTPAEVALNWIAHRPDVTSTLIGATKMEQLEVNLHVLDFKIPEAVSSKLETVSRPEVQELDNFFGPVMQGMIHGGVPVRR
jgi:aryl-alcohol dehydrogenase-like predicted oxidoreductase